MILLKVELSLEGKLRLSSSGVEQSPEKACVGGANPSSATTPKFHLEIISKKFNLIVL